jgi:hypothetical protein
VLLFTAYGRKFLQFRGERKRHYKPQVTRRRRDFPGPGRYFEFIFQSPNYRRSLLAMRAAMTFGLGSHHVE